MGYKIGVLTLHGMGNQEENYYRSWKKNIRRKLSAEAKRAVVFEAVYYQDVMQEHQTRFWENRLDWQTKSLCPLVLVILLGVTVWLATAAVVIGKWGLLYSHVPEWVPDAIKPWGLGASLALVLLVVTVATFYAATRLSRPAWINTRQFVLYALSDPATYAYKPEECDSVYRKVHERISKSLRKLCEELDEDGCVVVVAHSLGAHVLSNHIWDAKKRLKSIEDGTADCQAESEECEESKQEYERIKKIKRIFTAGANITLFVAGRPEVKPFAKPNDGFEWHNFYDEDDVLGWPLQQLPPKDGKSYADLVKVECRINVGGLSKSWNPRSHTEYFGRGTKFIKHVAEEIEELHPRKSETKAA